MVDVRTATPEDAAAIARINVRGWRAAYRGLFPDEFLDAMEPAGPERFVTNLLAQSPPCHAAVAVSGDQVIGFVLLGPPIDPTPGSR